jgi:hypothetical protein
MAFCMQCGNQLNEGSAFCGKCGAKVYTGATQSHPTNNGFFNQLNSTVKKALNVSPSELLDVRLSPEDLSEQERKVIMAYRTKPDLRKAVNILLGIE